MLTLREVREYLGRHVHCHTHFGSFQGMVVHVTRHHLILQNAVRADAPIPSLDHPRGLFGPGPNGMPPGPPQNPYGPPGGPQSPWHLAIPLAAILGITAIGIHWW
ncbi:hypothetical protein, partial [Alicyclobacillus acidocaldarius]